MFPLPYFLSKLSSLSHFNHNSDGSTFYFNNHLCYWDGSFCFTLFFLRQKKQNSDQNSGWCHTFWFSSSHILWFASSWDVRYDRNVFCLQLPSVHSPPFNPFPYGLVVISHFHWLSQLFSQLCWTEIPTIFMSSLIYSFQLTVLTQ